MIATYKFADIPIAIDSLYPQVQEMCKNYQYNGPPDFRVRSTQADIDFERGRSGSGSGYYSTDPYLETLAVYRKIAEAMPARDVFLFHGSALAVDGEGYIFTARSGTGKSTHAGLWRRLLKDRVTMVNDDKPFIRVTEAGPLVCGTPWAGKENLHTNTIVPLKAICLLERAEENRIREITKSEALPVLIQQTYRPFTPEALAKTLTLLDRLNPLFFRLGCNMDISAAELSCAVMKEAVSP